MSHFNDIKALFINCSIKHDKNESHTQLLIDRAAGIMESEGVDVEKLFAPDYKIPFGMEKDLKTSDGIDDDWPRIQKKIMEGDILVVGTPIWLGAKSSVATNVIERMYAYSGERNDKDQYLYYGKTAGCIVTGNEDGAKAVAMETLYALSHIGYTIPPQADCGWLGEIGPGPSYGDKLEGEDVPAGFDSDFTNRNTTYMCWNLMHTARMLKDNRGLPSKGNNYDWRKVTNAADQNIKGI